MDVSNNTRKYQLDLSDIISMLEEFDGKIDDLEKELYEKDERIAYLEHLLSTNDITY